jgi:peroxiredoxin
VNLWNSAQLALWVVVLFNLLLTYALIRKVARSGGHSGIGGLSAGVTAPEFQADTPDGRRLSLRELGEQTPLVLGFFSPSCDACEMQMPDFAAFVERAHASGIRTVAVLDGEDEESSRLQAALPGDTTALLAPRRANPLLNDYRVEAYPSYTVIRADGTVDGTYGRVAEIGERLKTLSRVKARR